MTKVTNSKPSPARLNLPGAYRRPKRNAGSCTIYWYVSREPGAELLAQYDGATWAEAVAAEIAGEADRAKAYGESRSPRINPGFMRALIRDFEAQKLPDMKPTTQTVWKGHLRQIEAVFGDTSLKGMQQRPDEYGRGLSARRLIIQWHKKTAQWDAAAKRYRQPRTANYRLTVLVRVLNWGKDQERIRENVAEGIERLDEGPGRASIIWTPEELTALLKHCPPHVARGVRMAALTGLRKEDVVTLQWDQIEEHVIRRPTSKSNQRQRAAIPIYPALRDLLKECRAACPEVGDGRVVVNLRKRGWKDASAFDSSLRPAITAYRAAGGAAKRFHDLRGTAATAMYRDGVPLRLIALALGWSEREAENRINDYVDLTEAARAMAAGVKG